MRYTADRLEQLDRTYFRFPPGRHVVESRCGREVAITVTETGEIVEFYDVSSPASNVTAMSERRRAEAAERRKTEVQKGKPQRKVDAVKQRRHAQGSRDNRRIA